MPARLSQPAPRPTSTHEPALALEAGTKLAGKYRLLRPAGFGGMAQLWVAQNEATGAEVCVKVLVPERQDDESVQRFRREAHAAARLSHRAIVKTFDLVELDAAGEVSTSDAPTALAIVMELLVGETLGDRILQRDKLALDEALDIAMPILSARALAHRAGIVHRDIKPDNVFLSRDGDGQLIPKMLDFGVSKIKVDGARTLTCDGVVLGTPSFMSPEQASGKSKVDARSDVFSMATLLYTMLTGRSPFERDAFHDVITSVLEAKPDRLPGLSEAMWATFEKAFQKNPNHRYADATEFGLALRRAAGRNSLTDSGAFPVPVEAGASWPPVGTHTTESRPAHEDAEEKERPVSRRLVFTVGVVVFGLALAGVFASRGRHASEPLPALASSPSPVTEAPVRVNAVVTPVAQADGGSLSPGAAPPGKTQRRTAPAAKGAEREIARDPGF